MSTDDIVRWMAPKWHADFGDPATEMRLLQQFCLRLVALLPELTVELDCFEPGYMAVNIYRNADKCGELHVVVKEPTPRYGLFFTGLNNDEEYYFEAPDDGIKRLASAIGY